MSPVVLDTDVVSFLFKKNTRAELYVEHLRDRQVLISFMTQAELEQWVLLSNWSAQRIEWLRLYLAGAFVLACAHRGHAAIRRVLPFHEFARAAARKPYQRFAARAALP